MGKNDIIDDIILTQSLRYSAIVKKDVISYMLLYCGSPRLAAKGKRGKPCTCIC
jgi:hypothetical protein